MVSSINGSESSAIQQMMATMFQKMGAADTDGTAGLSKSELSSVDAGSDVGGSAFLKSLTDQFDQIDTDGNGQLSKNEIASAKPHKGAMGPPPGLEIEGVNDTDSTSSSSNGTSIEELLAKFIKSLDTNGDGQISEEELKAAMQNAQNAQTKQNEHATQSTTANNQTGKAASLESNSMGTLAQALVQKAINTYQSGGLAGVASSLSIAG